MKKSVVSRILGLVALYCAVFVVLVMIQFSKQGNFNYRIGSMTISGRYRMSDNGEAPANPNEHLLDGGVLVSFGGLEFSLKNKSDRFDDKGFVLIDSEGRRQPAIPESLSQTGDTARFRLPGGTEIAFTSLYSGGGPELWIAADLYDGVSALEIPFKPQRSSIARNTENGRLDILYNDTYYQFTHYGPEEEPGRLLLNGARPAVSYRARPRQQGSKSADFVISRARSEQTFNDALAAWLDQSFSRWSRTAPADEDTVIAYSGAAIERDNYQAAVASASSAFPADRRTYESSVYLGGMVQARRSFTAVERETLNRVTRLINTKSPDLLKESRVFEFLAVRNLTAQINNGLEYISSIAPESLTVDLIPGVFEGYADVKQLSLQAGNPFERLIEQSCRLISEGIQKDAGGDLVLVYHNGRAEIELNLRLGQALRRWAAGGGTTDAGSAIGADDSAGWAALGRSLVLSALFLTDGSGTAPRTLARSTAGEKDETPEERISAARLYRILGEGEYYPRAAGIGSGANAVWAWTASPAVSAVQNAEMLDIAVSFPVNETHYMIIRGIRPFGRLQLYDIDFRSDSQFERYNSSGWIYYPEDRILVVKMRHRSATEHIRIFFRREPEARSSAETGADAAQTGAASGAANETSTGGETIER
jgi:hypothetical protein